MSAELAIFTIGVYGKSESAFFDQLEIAKIDCFIDVRRRRGMRGPAYAFANSRRLQAALAQRQIAYRHERDLAPTNALRSLQKRIDGSGGVNKRSRESLSEEFVTQYLQQISTFTFDDFFETLVGRKRLVFFCVEAHPDACHRSVLASEIARRRTVTVTHL